MRTNKFFALAALAVVAMACTKTPEAAKIDLSQSQIVVSANEGQATLTFNANNDWTAVSNADWLTVSETNGKAGKAEIALSYAKNSTWEDRSAEVTIKAGEAVATCKVTQKFETYFGTDSDIILTQDAQVFDITVTTNEEFKVKIEFPEEEDEWLEQVVTKAAPVENILTFSAEANETSFARAASIVIETASGNTTYSVLQNSVCSPMQLMQAGYIGNRQNPYDVNNYVPTAFGQYLVMFEEGENTISIVLNVDKATADPATLPAGTYECDYTGNNDPGTFAIKKTNDNQPAYTTILDKDENETLVFDGVIEVAVDNGSTVIVATLMDENAKVYNLAWQGTNPTVENLALGTKVYIDYRADYDTYFTTKATGWSGTIYPSEAPEGCAENVYTLNVNFFGSAGITDIAGLEEGTYTFAVPESTGTGKLNAQPFTFSCSGGYANYNYDADADEVTYDNVDVLSGTITISEKNDVSFKAEYNLRLKVYRVEYDEDWNPIELDPREVDYTFTDDDALYIAGDSGMRACPDTDHEFKALGFQPQYQGMWYGKGKITDNANLVCIQWSYVDTEYTIILEANVTGWEFEKNYAGRYCNTPIPDGKYEFSYTRADNTMPNLKKPANYRACVVNNYTGTRAYIRSGNVEISNGKVTFNFYAAPATADGYGDPMHFTGTLDCSCQLIQDRSTTAVEFNDDEAK